jgi:hypothetical protein
MKKLIVASFILLLAACSGTDEKAKLETKPNEPLTKSKNSPQFNQSFSQLTDAYFLLKESFIAENDTAINANAKKLILAADSLLLQELKADSSIVETAKSLSQSLSAELKGLTGEKVLLQKRKSFNIITDLVYNLIRTVQYDREVVYYQRCPMAFEDGDPNAFWLSKSSDIRNPYHPKTMLSCGEVVDSLKYIP